LSVLTTGTVSVATRRRPLLFPQDGIHPEYAELIDDLIDKGDQPKNVRSYIVVRAKAKNPGGNWEKNIPTLKQV
jgi:hypothetical protein